jgi:acetyl-CoA carboxylase biotin carboxyl carrier protein
LSEQKIPYYLTFGDVIRVLRLIDESPFQELQLELGDLKLHVVQDKEPRPAAHPAASAAPATEAPPAPVAEPAREQASVAPDAVAVAITGKENNGTPVLAPLAGTFYRAPSPGAPPFVEVGTAVKQGDVVGILEIMKLMNHVSAPCAGVIREIRAKNEQFVEFGQVLAVIDTQGAG